MCGISGYWVSEGAAAPRFAAELTVATRAMAYRGPDDEGYWNSDDQRVGFGHRRLAILDLSPLGHQPMFSRCGQWVMVFNGEVYNYATIRAELQQRGHAFSGTGDSEVILAAFSEWGPAAVERFIGFFAIALWHKSTGTLHLLRDRLGVKPLYYHWDGRTLCFGSELKVLRAFSGWRPEIDRAALGDYFRYGYIVEPRSIYQRVFKLPPAHRLELSAQGALSLHRYWNVLDHCGKRSAGSEEVLADELEALMIDAFKLRMISDVPVGVFLSGGIDSSVLAAILQQHGGQRIKTFTIGFDVAAYDESPQAEAIAKHLGTEHHCRILRVNDAKEVLPRWGELYDEPFADSSGIPTFMVSRVAAEQVKVVLSADGGDELFSGYASYASAIDQWSRIRALPRPLRRGIGAALDALQVQSVNDALATRGPSFAGRLASRLVRIAERSRAGGIGDYFETALTHFRRDELRRMLGVEPAPRKRADDYPGSEGERLCLWDLENYMPGDILTKVDRATMAVSIEGREPLIDHRLVEFAFSLPFHLRRGSLGSKHLLRKVLYRYVPRELVDRPKRGFGIPVQPWLRTDLRPLVGELLSPQQLQHGLFNTDFVAQAIKRLDAGDVTAQQQVWNLVAFQMWYSRWGAGVGAG